MKRYKKLLAMFNALGIVSSISIAAEAEPLTKHEKLYNNMVKNIKQGKSNTKNYKILEEVLKQRNKELKDLYLQSDYIVKPEYLEWQIFFSGFYEEYGEGRDNTKENALYRTDVEGYYDTTGNFIMTGGKKNGVAGKPYQPLQKAKEIDLGVSIPLKEIKREPINLSLSPTPEIVINPNVPTINIPNSISAPTVNSIDFQPISPNLVAPIPVIVNPINLSFPGSGNGDNTWFGLSGNNAPISQQSMMGAGGGTGTFETLFTNGNNIRQYINNTTLQGYMGGHTLPSGVAHTENNYRFSGTAFFGSMLLVGGELIPINNMNLTVLKLLGSNNLAVFHTDSHNDHGSSIWRLDNTNVILKGDRTILYDVQYHGSVGDSGMSFDNGNLIADNSTSYTSIYDGTTYNYTPQNRYIFVTIADGGGTARYLYFKNEANGNIYLNGTRDILSNFASEDNINYGGSFFENRGIIELNGVSSMGSVFAREYNRSWIRYENALNLNGDKSVGVAFTFNFNTNSTLGAGLPGVSGPTYEKSAVKDSVLNIKIGEKQNPNDADSNDITITGNTAALVEQATALYFNNSSGTMKDYKIMHTQLDALEYSKKATLISLVKGKVILDGTDTTNRLKIDGGTGKTGIDSIGIYAGALGTPGTTQSTIESYIPLTITNSDLSTAIFGEKRANIINNGNITISGSNGVKGIVVDSLAQSTIGGNITISNGGVYTDSSNIKTGSVVIGALGGSSVLGTGTVTADVSGKESIVFYADNSTINITNNSSNIKALDGAFVMTSTNGGTIKYAGNSIEAGERSLIFYLDNSSKIEITGLTTAKITGASNATDRGTAFYYKSLTPYGTFNSSDISTYFANRFNSTLGNLTLNMEDGSRLFIVDNVAMDLSNTNLGLGIIPNAPIINTLGTSYKTFMLYQSDLTIDQAINLDSLTDDYNNLEIVTSKIANSGQMITGSQANQIALAQENGLTPGGVALPRNTVVLTNNGGIITLGGVNSVGIYANNGEINNTGSGQINVTGAGSVGIYGVNDSLIDNQASSTIQISNSGVGIYGEGYKQGTAQAFGNGKINITNSGLIHAVNSTNAIGIYANNNSTGNPADSQINLSSGTIDVSASTGGVGVHLDKGTLTDISSTITVGKNGLAIYAKDSAINLGGSTVVNLNGDNALGVYLAGNSTVSSMSNLTFNISGQNVMLFNLDFSTAPTPVLINAGFGINSVASGSSYIGGNIINGHIKYTTNTSMYSNGVLFNGKNSEIVIDSGSTIQAVAGANNIAAVVIDGNINPPGTWLSRPNIDGENQGTIILGDQSVGILGKNGARLLNSGNILVGNESVGLKSYAAQGEIFNEGIITIGSKSQGMFLKDGIGNPTGDLVNETTGQILSTAGEAVGMFGDDVEDTINRGLINLTGDSSIGMYITGVIPYRTLNDGIINMGNSSNVNNPSIGIYSITAGESITNNGTITLGQNSIGIYGDQLLINHNGTLNIGDNGVGIYSTNGTVALNTGSALNFGTNEAVGVYGLDTTIVNSSSFNLGNKNYGFILEGGSLTNNVGTTATLGQDSVYLYSTKAPLVVNNGDLYLTGNDNIAFYTAADSLTGIGGANVTNTGIIDGTSGHNNIGIYNYGGVVTNTGSIKLGDSDLVLKTDATGALVVDVDNSKYSVGIYGENSSIDNQGSIVAGYGAVGVVAKGGSAINKGMITTTGNYSMGMYTEGGVITNDTGAIINVTGNNTVGMAGKGTNSHIINHGTINVLGDNSIAMYGSYGTIITNTGVINITGTNSNAFVSPDPLDPNHFIAGTVNGAVANSSYIHQSSGVHQLPTLVNAGIIKTNGVLALDGIQVLIQPNPSTVTPSSDPDYDFELSGTAIIADRIVTDKPIKILPGFADGTIADVYKLEGVIQATSGKYDFISGSLLWEATPKVTSTGSDVYMSRKAYLEFASGLWFEDFGKALDDNFLNARNNEKATEIYNKTGYIKTEEEFRHIMGSLAGNVYANINQRENDIARAFEDSLHILQDSTNNTKENVKISVIGGKGKNKEETDGVVGYDYTTTGVLALREVERTYKHTFGYSLGYVHTGFEFKDGNKSEEWVDTIQLGLHNKYNSKGWQLRNDLTGRASIHNVDRNIDWESPLKRSEMNGTYETYSITSDNILGKEFELGKKVSIMPYGGVRAMYVMRPTFEEKGLEALELEGNDAWSAKPRAGVELKGILPIGTSWQLKGTLDFAYEYELADLNEREKARLIAVENGYHKLSKPEDEKGTFRTKATIGAEAVDRYGIFLTGEYSTGNDKESDYRAGVTLKAVF
ncbi:autotransporter domain-containing protein [Sebaldella sp. S0638]|uniref:autotransporter domain-containing protein n=1 Tax=Sebaldella sp. S0638 TaxID=2957809 RepID=UPI00209E32CA|nr:autotransporter domain-containing protein [Sebaldella sp. S0638]MCP1226061.1 autotransporter domain-containing protein [Sebaldella sp. S0638]